MATSGKIAVITGAGSGIGRATALALFADGFTVVLAGRRRAMLEETAALAKAMPPRMLVVPTDVTDPASIAALFDAVKATYGRIDLLFNNAGTSTRNIPIEDLTLEQWSNVVAVNLTGSFLCAQHAFRMMKDQTPRGGRIIRLGFGPCAAAQFDPVRRDEACADRTDPVVVARWARIRYRLWPDRHRQRRDHA
jgi:NAD(P)-dependent dehydrogenase (short-subunit alcohol dehydrogenase family)